MADVRTLERSARTALATSMRGRLILRGDKDYDEARAVYNGMHDKRPGVILRCADAEDVAKAVRFAAGQDVDVAVRGGGHSGPGFGSVDDGIVIDLSGMRAVEVDPGERVLRAQGGCTVADLDNAGHEHGLATTMGTVSSTGIAGLTLGGGFGHLTRRAGLSCDNLLSAEVVTANGEIVTADEHSHPDLFWALRGGGGNFGIVTRFTYRAHTAGMVTGGPIVFAADQAPAALRAYADLTVHAPEHFGGVAGIAKLPPFPFLPEQHHLTLGCIVLVCWTGVPEEVEDVIAPLRAAATPVGEGIGPMPYPVMNTLFDEALSPGLQHYWKGMFARELSDDAIAVHLEHAVGWPNPAAGTFIFPISGAAAAVAPDATAFGHRDARFNLVMAGVWPDPADTEVNRAMVRDYFEAVRPYGEEGTYINFAAADDAYRTVASYGANYDRLATVKAKYDPTNLFHVNLNIEPRA